MLEEEEKIYLDERILTYKISLKGEKEKRIRYGISIEEKAKSSKKDNLLIASLLISININLGKLKTCLKAFLFFLFPVEDRFGS